MQDRMTHPDDLLDPPAELLVGQGPHDLDIRVPIESFAGELTLCAVYDDQIKSRTISSDEHNTPSQD